jgi:uncharacterized protein
MSRALGAAIGLLAVTMGLLLAIWSLQRKLIYFPLGSVPSPAAAGLRATVVSTFPTEDGLTLNGWFVRPEGEPWFTVIVFNGNAGHRGMRAPLADALVRHGISVMLFDYRGFGDNPGMPTEAGLIADARAARRYVLGMPGVTSTRLAYFGESLGAAVAVQLAAEHPPAAAILRSPFASLADVGQFHYPYVPVGWLLRDRFASVEFIGRIKVPLLVIAGEDDRVVPLTQTKRLVEAAHQPKSLLIIEGADHNDGALDHGDDMIQAIVEFLRSVARHA